MSDKKKTLLLCALLYAAILLLCAVFVNTHDDYFVPETGTDLPGSAQYALTMGNGRYVGNFLGTYLSVRYVPNLLVRSVLLFALVMGVSAVYTDFMPGPVLLGAVLMLFPGLAVYTQAYQWSHGFYNYAPPVAMLLAGMALVRRSAPTAGRNAVLVALGVLQSLFAENVTVVAAFTAALLLADKLYRRQDMRSAAFYFLGSVLGAALMFLGPRLAQVSGTLGWYRGVSTADVFFPRLIENVIIIARVIPGWNGLFAALFSLLLLRQRHVRAKGGWLGLWVMGLSFAVMQVLMRLVPPYDTPYLCPSLTALIGTELVLILSAFVLVWRLSDRETLYDLLIPVLGAGASVAELLFVQPIGARCLLITYALLAAAVMRLWSGELSRSPWTDKLCRRVAALVGVVLYAMLLPLQIADFRAAVRRDASIRAQLAEGKTEIAVFGLPYPDIVYKADIFALYHYTFNCGDPSEMQFILTDR